MKNSFILVLISALLVAACGGADTGTPAAKKQRLAALLKDQSRLAVEVAELEQELAAADKPVTSNSEKPKAVTVAQVSATTFKHYIEVQGSVTTNNVVTVNAKMPGTLEAVYVSEGDIVKKGQILAKIDNAVSQSSLKELQTRLQVAEDLYARQSALWEQKIGSELQYINAKANRDGLLRSINTLNTQIRQTLITAPISGTIDATNARVGETAQNPAGLFKIVNLSELKISADVAEAYLLYLKKGASVEVDFPELNQTQNGKIFFISSTVNPTSRTITVEARVPSTNKLRPNMLAKVRVNDQTLPNTIAIDQNLVQTNESGDIVYVVAQKDGKSVAESRKIVTGLSYNGRVQIISGLRPGDALITLGYQDVTDGQAIAF